MRDTKQRPYPKPTNLLVLCDVELNGAVQTGENSKYNILVDRSLAERLTSVVLSWMDYLALWIYDLGVDLSTA